MSGLNQRTIQRLESGAKISSESLRALAAVFEVSTESLLLNTHNSSQTAFKAMSEGVLAGLEFTDTTARADFCWFALGVIMLLAFAHLLSSVFGSLPLKIVSLLVLLPWIAAFTRRLRDAGLSPWWQLISLVPVAGLAVLLYLLAYRSKDVEPIVATSN